MNHERHERHEKASQMLVSFAPFVVTDIPPFPLSDFSENPLVEQPALALFQEPSYAIARCFYERVGGATVQGLAKPFPPAIM